MNNPSPLVPKGYLLEQKNSSRSRVKVAFFCIVGVNVVGLMVLLMQGCKREQESQPTIDPSASILIDTNLPGMDTNVIPTTTVDTNVHYAPPIPETTVVTPPATTQQEYVIQRGDSFFTIGKKLNVPWTAIRDANPTVNPSKLKIGQSIVIPAVTAPATPGGSALGVSIPATGGSGEPYTVKSGDTLTKIASQHGFSVKALRAANPNLKTDKIKVGDKLNLPAKVVAPPTVETVPVAPSAPVLQTPPPAPR